MDSLKLNIEGLVALVGALGTGLLWLIGLRGTQKEHARRIKALEDQSSSINSTLTIINENITKMRIENAVLLERVEHIKQD